MNTPLEKSPSSGLRKLISPPGASISTKLDPSSCPCLRRACVSKVPQSTISTEEGNSRKKEPRHLPPSHSPPLTKPPKLPQLLPRLPRLSARYHHSPAIQLPISNAVHNIARHVFRGCILKPAPRRIDLTTPGSIPVSITARQAELKRASVPLGSERVRLIRPCLAVKEMVIPGVSVRRAREVYV